MLGPLKLTLRPLFGQVRLSLTASAYLVFYPTILPVGDINIWPAPTRNGRPCNRLMLSISPRGIQLAVVLNRALRLPPQCLAIAANARLTSGPTIPAVAPIFGRQGPRPQARLIRNTRRRSVPIRWHPWTKSEPLFLPQVPVTVRILRLALFNNPNRWS